MSTIYDLIIVGGGIAGLRVGIESLKRYPNIKCCILEKYGYIGGRIVTFRKDIPKIGKVQWEIGAGRISTSHTKVLALFKKYGLTFIPMSDDVDFINDHTNKEPIIVANNFTDLIDIYLGPLGCLSTDVLATHTIKGLLNKTVGQEIAKKFYEQFPYYSEIHVLRADSALDAFRKEMGTNNGFGGCKEGLSSITDAMSNEFIQLGGKILLDMDVFKITSNFDKSIRIDCTIRNTARRVSYIGKTTVLALHHSALKKINGVNKMEVLNHLTMTPLLRIYAIFPSKGGVSWFSGLNKTVTNSQIRYIIPIDSTRGIIMISYTDGHDASWWIKQGENAAEHGEENVKDLIMIEIRKLFPDRTIPNPIFFKQHPWHDGCTYWLPGSYNIEEESIKSLHPMPDKMPNLFMCGESFAVKQCWIESALDQADKLLDNNKFTLMLNKIKYYL
jgi:hypothetical protein